MVRALWDDVPRREGGSNGAKVASGGSDRRGTYVLGGGGNKINLETSGIITQLFTLPGAAQNETKHPHEPFLVVQCSNTPN